MLHIHIPHNISYVWNTVLQVKSCFQCPHLDALDALVCLARGPAGIQRHINGHGQG